MRKKLIYFLIFIMIVPIIVPITSYASLSSEVSTEASSRPISTGGGSSNTGGSYNPPGGSPNDTVTVDPNKQSGTVIIPVECSISGNVWEDLRNFDQEIGTYTRNNQLDENEKGTLSQNNIRLEVRKVGSDQVYAMPTIGSDGSYRFVATEDGEYYVRIYFGLLEDSDYSNSNKIESILKYNGQDYLCSKAGNAGEIDVTYRQEIISSGKGCTQIYLALDCSNSMTQKQEDGTTRLETEIKSAKKLIEELLEGEDNNIYIGLVAFGEYPYKIQGLTKSKERLNQKLDEALKEAQETNYYAGSTDIKSVLYGIRNNKTKINTGDGTLQFQDEEYFVNTDKENSNRYVFLLSDGVPLSDGENVVYNDDSEQEVYRKVERIIENTRNEMREMMNDGIHESVLITKTWDEEVDGYVKDMCTVEQLQAYLIGADTPTTQIAKLIKDHIMETSIEESTFTDKRYLEAGKENEQRRKEINENCNIQYYYDEVIKYDILENYDSRNEEHQQIAREISEKTYCFADTATYQLYQSGKQWQDHIEQGVNPDGSEYTIVYIKSAELNIPGVDMVLTTRDNFMIKPIIKVTGVRITLPNGYILTEEIAGGQESRFTDNQLKTGEIRQIEELEKPICYYVDQEITQGSKLDIEYTIILKNIGLIPSTDVEVGVFAPKGFTVNSEQRLLSVDYSNQDYGWNITNYNDLLKTGYVSKDKRDEVCATLALSTAEENGLVRNTNIEANGERYLKLVVSKLLTTQGDEEGNYVAKTEILSYRNNEGRRMQVSVKQGVSELGTAGGLLSFFSVFAGNNEEEDFSEAQDVIVIPPTGLNLFKTNTIQLIQITLIISISIMVTIFLYFKRKIL